jgi:fibronectin type 3 domain-containing protein
MKKRLKNKLKKKILQRTDRKYIGFHVYRSVNENLPFIFWERITDEPVPDGNFDDKLANVGDRYFYRLTQVDANGSESAPIKPHVTFKDHAGNKLDQNPLVDFVGYNIYRSIDKDVPLDEWERRNIAPLETTEFKDEGVTSGEVFFYYVRAVDSLGTESAPGEVIRVIRK